MTGVRVGTRLDQLLALRRQVDQEIATERRRLALDVGHRPAATLHVDEPPPKGDASVAALARHRLTAKQVKVWAVSVGLLDEVKRGRVAADLVHAYVDAHQDQP